MVSSLCIVLVDDENVSTLGNTEFKKDHPQHDTSLIVSWSSLLPLLTRCQTFGCSSIVEEENMESQRDGRNHIIVII